MNRALEGMGAEIKRRYRMYVAQAQKDFDFWLTQQGAGTLAAPDTERGGP